MYILGIVEGHNCSAALLKDGETIAVCFPHIESGIFGVEMGLKEK